MGIPVTYIELVGDGKIRVGIAMKEGGI